MSYLSTLWRVGPTTDYGHRKWAIRAHSWLLITYKLFRWAFEGCPSTTRQTSVDCLTNVRRPLSKYPWYRCSIRCRMRDLERRPVLCSFKRIEGGSANQKNLLYKPHLHVHDAFRQPYAAPVHFPMNFHWSASISHVRITLPSLRHPSLDLPPSLSWTRGTGDHFVASNKYCPATRPWPHCPAPVCVVLAGMPVDVWLATSTASTSIALGFWPEPTKPEEYIQSGRFRSVEFRDTSHTFEGVYSSLPSFTRERDHVPSLLS